MGVDREFRIKITTVADASGAEQTSQALNTLSSKTSDYISRLKEQSRASEEVDVAHRNLRLGLSMISPELAEAGHAAIALFANPLTAAFVGVSFLIGRLVQDHAKLKAALESETDLIQKRDGARFIGVYLGMIAEHDGKGGVQMWSATSGELLRWISFGEFKAIYVDKTRREYQ